MDNSLDSERTGPESLISAATGLMCAEGPEILVGEVSPRWSLLDCVPTVEVFGQWSYIVRSITGGVRPL